MNLEKRFHLFQDFLIEMSNGAIYNVRSINLEKLAKPTVRYESNTYYRDSFHMADINMNVRVTDYVLTIDVVSRCPMDELWRNELVNMFRGTFSSLLPPNCKVDINPLTNELRYDNFYA
jgi:hypothetical protein